MAQTGNRSAGRALASTGGASGGYRGLRRMADDFVRHPLAVAGLVVLVVAALDTLLAPLLISTSAVTTINVDQRFQGPSGAHPLGTDALGRDELAQLLMAVHSAMLVAGAVLVLAAVVAAIVCGAARLLGGVGRRDWARWVEVVLTPIVGVLLLGGASLVLSRQAAYVLSPTLFSSFFNGLWYVIRHPLSIGAEFHEDVGLVLLELLLAGELARFGYLLFQRIRAARGLRAAQRMAAAVPPWLSVVGPAVAVGLWTAADTLLVEPYLLFYWFYWFGEQPVTYGGPVAHTASLGEMLTAAATFFTQYPPFVLVPLAAILVLYASLNLVGFGLRRVWGPW